MTNLIAHIRSLMPGLTPREIAEAVRPPSTVSRRGFLRACGVTTMAVAGLPLIQGSGIYAMLYCNEIEIAGPLHVASMTPPRRPLFTIRFDGMPVFDSVRVAESLGIVKSDDKIIKSSNGNLWQRTTRIISPPDA